MLIGIRHLVDRLQHQRARADDLRELRRRHAALPDASAGDSESIAIARELRELRERLSGEFAPVESCRGCARGHPEPYGHWPGGHCCGGRTEQVFTDDELAALKLAGTTAADFRAPRSDLAGCAFRGPAGCSLPAAHRPSVCVRYTCRELEAELDTTNGRAEIVRLQARMRELSERFAERRRNQVEAALFGDVSP